jgi:excisionase family DNA binding protein
VTRQPPPRYDELPDLCTPAEARQFLQIGRDSIYSLLRSGAIPHVKFGRLIRIPKTALLPAVGDPEVPRRAFSVRAR